MNKHYYCIHQAMWTGYTEHYCVRQATWTGYIEHRCIRQAMWTGYTEYYTWSRLCGLGCGIGHGEL